MQAMVLVAPHTPLQSKIIQRPVPGLGQLLVKVHVCGVCRTDLHVADGELPNAKSPIVPGHEIVGTIAQIGSGVDGFALGERVGIPWLGFTCGVCRYCRSGLENLCDQARFSGYTLDGGYAEYVVADSRYCFRLPSTYSDLEVAPLLCAGLIGYRALRMAGDAQRIGIYGFGAAAHIISQVIRYQHREVYAFTRPRDIKAQQFARELGATWVGGSDEQPPEPFDAALIFAPVGGLVPVALRNLTKGGSVICAGIHMSDIPAFPYAILWGERRICSVANLTRADGLEFFQLATQMHLRTRVIPYALQDANRALHDLRDGKISGAAVLTVAN